MASSVACNQQGKYLTLKVSLLTVKSFISRRFLVKKALLTLFLPLFLLPNVALPADAEGKSCTNPYGEDGEERDINDDGSLDYCIDGEWFY
jgi:hypothetical protein